MYILATGRLETESLGSFTWPLYACVSYSPKTFCMATLHTGSHTSLLGDLSTVHVTPLGVNTKCLCPISPGATLSTISHFCFQLVFYDCNTLKLCVPTTFLSFVSLIDLSTERGPGDPHPRAPRSQPLRKVKGTNICWVISLCQAVCYGLLP